MVLAAQKLGCRYVVVLVPTETQATKIANLESLGAQVWVFSKNGDYEYMDRWLRRSAKMTNLTYVPAFDHERVIAGGSGYSGPRDSSTYGKSPHHTGAID